MTREARTGDYLLAHDLKESQDRRVQRSIMTCLRAASGAAASALPILRDCLKSGNVIRADTGTVFEGETAAAMHRMQTLKAETDAELAMQKQPAPKIGGKRLKCVQCGGEGPEIPEGQFARTEGWLCAWCAAGAVRPDDCGDMNEAIGAAMQAAPFPAAPNIG